MKVGIVGAGSMAAAIARGWTRAEDGPEVVLLSDSGSGRAKELAGEIGGEAVPGNGELAQRADVVVLAMKAPGLDAVAAEISPAGKPVISVLGATSLDRLREALPGLPVMRTMPNLAVELGRGVICWAASEEVNRPTREQLLGLLEPLGMPIELDDSLIDPATAVMGCSPAYVALVAEALIDSAVREGVPEDPARAMVLETLAGTALLLEDRHPRHLRDAVASPGGSTEAGLEALERGGMRETLESAVEASLERMRG